MNEAPSKIGIEYSLPSGAYLAVMNSDEAADFERLRALVTRMIETGELKDAGFNIGRNGGFAFRLGSVREEPAIACLDSVADVCTVLEPLMNERLEAFVPAT